MPEHNKILPKYLLPTMLNIVIVAVLVLILSKAGVMTGYGSLVGIALIVCGGISSALWGVVYQVRNNGRSVRQVFLDFINVLQPLRAYLLAFTFLIIDFAGVLICRGFKADHLWIPIVFFLKAIAFGGIEEIGWRYTFQPFMEQRMSYVPATLCTFVCWSIWHILFFYVDGTLLGLEAGGLISFLFGLLTLSFILSALYKKTGSLWICVMTHALVNTGAQLTANDNAIISAVAKVICILLAIWIAEGE